VIDEHALARQYLTAQIAQMIWECYAVETGRSLPSGLADRTAERIVSELVAYD
jgi:hypothetical protein